MRIGHQQTALLPNSQEERRAVSARRRHRAQRRLPLILFNFCTVAFIAGGCTSKNPADARVRAAFVAGQQEAIARFRQDPNSGTNVMVMGAVRNNQIPWTSGLTLANALVAADYLGLQDPREIILNRGGEQIRIDPKQLLRGQDVPVEPRDVVEIR